MHVGVYYAVFLLDHITHQQFGVEDTRLVYETEEDSLSVPYIDLRNTTACGREPVTSSVAN